MPKWTKLVAGWALAATIALAFSWGAVGQVRSRVIAPTVEIPTSAASASAPPVVGLTPEPADPSTSTTRISGVATETTLATTPTTSTGPSSSTTIPPTATSIIPQPPGSTSTTSTPPPSTTVTTATAAPQTQTSSYSLVGGVVTISYSPGVVLFESAIPQPGYSTDPRETGPGEVRVRFESGNHTSDFRAEWKDGELEVTRNETGQ